eukprot:COSAG04_NODE_150_length_22521_cov_10.008385_4_plen_190_part_00
MATTAQVAADEITMAEAEAGAAPETAPGQAAADQAGRDDEIHNLINRKKKDKVYFYKVRFKKRKGCKRRKDEWWPAASLDDELKQIYDKQRPTVEQLRIIEEAESSAVDMAVDSDAQPLAEGPLAPPSAEDDAVMAIGDGDAEALVRIRPRPASSYRTSDRTRILTRVFCSVLAWQPILGTARGPLRRH